MYAFPKLPPPPLPPWATPLQVAYRAGRSANLDQVWLMRLHEQQEANKGRLESWRTRFLVLGPRQNDLTAVTDTE